MQIPRTVEPTGTDEDVDMQTATTTGGTSTPAIIPPTEDKPASAPRITELTSGALADEMHVCENCGGSPPPRLKLIRDIDSSLTSSVLEYLKGGGYFEAARGMEGVLRRRLASESDIDNNNNNNERTAERDVDEDMDKLEGENAVEDKQEAHHEVSEEEILFLRLKACREAYVRGDMYQVVSFLLNTKTNTDTGNVETTTTSTAASSSSPSAQVPLVDADFLQGYKGGIWAFRIRLQHFYSLFRGDLPGTGSTLASPSSRVIGEFFYGPDHNLNSTSSESKQNQNDNRRETQNRLTSLLAAGQHLHACHSASTEKEVVEGLDVFALMAYENVQSAPAGLVSRMGETGRRREAGELFGDVRGESPLCQERSFQTKS
jgi:hypothetical protein